MTEFDPGEFDKPLTAEQDAEQPVKPTPWHKKIITAVTCVFTGKKKS